MKRKYVVILAAIFIGGLVLGFRLPRFFTDHRPPPDPSPFLSRHLELSPSQEEVLKPLNQEYFQQMRALHAQLEEERRTLGRLLARTPLDRERLHAQVDRIVVLQTHVQRLTVDHLVTVSERLEPRQRKEFISLIQKKLAPTEPPLPRDRNDDRWRLFRRHFNTAGNQ